MIDERLSKPDVKAVFDTWVRDLALYSMYQLDTEVSKFARTREGDTEYIILNTLNALCCPGGPSFDSDAVLKKVNSLRAEWKDVMK